MNQMFSKEELEIMNNLIGSMEEDTAKEIGEMIDCFLHPQISLFLPAYGQCVYATTANHKHPSYSFIYYFQTISDFIVEGEHLSYDLFDGKCMSVMSPNIVHQEVPQENFQSYIAIMVDKDFFETHLYQYTDELNLYKGEAFVPHPELLGLLRCFMLEMREDNYRDFGMINHLVTLINHLLIRSVLEVKLSVPLYNRFEVDSTVAYMNSNFQEKITIEDLATRVNLSTGHFSKTFKSITSKTPIEFLNEIRLQKAKDLLMNSEKTITDIAIECGFNTPSYFASSFLEHFKMTPSSFRGNLKSDRK